MTFLPMFPTPSIRGVCLGLQISGSGLRVPALGSGRKPNLNHAPGDFITIKLKL